MHDSSRRHTAPTSVAHSGGDHGEKLIDFIEAMRVSSVADYLTVCFVFISPDLDGYMAPQNICVSRVSRITSQY